MSAEYAGMMWDDRTPTLPQAWDEGFREAAFRDEISADFKSGKIGIENGWLVEYVDKHTCGTGKNGYYGQHEPGCGTVPLFDLWQVMVL